MPASNKIYGIHWITAFGLPFLVLGMILALSIVASGAPSPLPTTLPPLPPSAEQTAMVIASLEARIAEHPAPTDTNSVFGVVEAVEPRRTVVTVWLTDDLTGEPYAAVVHRSVRPVSFYKVEISEE